MTEIQLEVGKAYPNDANRGIVRVDPNTLERLGLNQGDVVALEGGETTAAKVYRADREDWDSGTIRLDSFTRRNARASIGEYVTVKNTEATEASRVVLAPTEDGGIDLGSGTAGMVKRQILERPLVEYDVVPVTSGTDSSFKRSPGEATPLVAVETDPDGILVITEETSIEIRETPVGGQTSSQAVTYEDIGGLEQEIQRVREMVELPMKHPKVFRKLGIEPPKGVLLHGVPGTGKTLLAKAVANETDANFFDIAGPEIISKYYGESEQQLRETFDEAEDEAPSIIFIDELDSIAPKRQEVTGEVERRVVAQLLTALDGLEERGEVVVIGATNRVDDVDPALRRPGRFDREIELDVPDESARHEILEIHTRGMPLANDVDLDHLASETHGFVGADIESLSKEAAMNALQGYLPEIDLDNEDIPPSLLDRMVVDHDDFQDARMEVDPSALREILVQIPNTGWDDVGGLEGPKQDLQESVEWPLRHPERFERIGIEPPSGVLLYGPPGTGKTLMAKAVASETDANFISVRGPELLSKWVGESERAVRRTFEKAREVAPCVVFFDELDSLASGRNESMAGNVTERVVNQLLSELDGIQKRENVMVVGATNRPDMLDPALVRPGRFDRLVLVGEPDRESREEILEIHTESMPLGADVNIPELAERTQRYVGSDLESLAREAGVQALREDPKTDVVKMRHFREAMEDIRPTITDDFRGYYEQVEEELFGEADSGPTSGGRREFQ